VSCHEPQSYRCTYSIKYLHCIQQNSISHTLSVLCLVMTLSTSTLDIKQQLTVVIIVCAHCRTGYRELSFWVLSLDSPLFIQLASWAQYHTTIHYYLLYKFDNNDEMVGFEKRL